MTDIDKTNTHFQELSTRARKPVENPAATCGQGKMGQGSR